MNASEPFPELSTFSHFSHLISDLMLILNVLHTYQENDFHCSQWHFLFYINILSGYMSLLQKMKLKDASCLDLKSGILTIHWKQSLNR